MSDGSCDSVDIFLGSDDFRETDGDLLGDCLDPCPIDFNDDSDSDGICDILDSDDDNDSWLDTDEDLCGTDSKNSTSIPEEIDGDRI